MIFMSLKTGYLQRTLSRFPAPLNRWALKYWSNSTGAQARKSEFNFAVTSAKTRMARGVDEGKHDFMSYMLKNNDDKGQVPLPPRSRLYLETVTDFSRAACLRARSSATRLF